MGGAPKISGSTKSLPDGSFTIHMVDSKFSLGFNAQEVQTVRVKFSKKSGLLHHKFLCGTVPGATSKFDCGGDPRVSNPLPSAEEVLKVRHFHFQQDRDEHLVIVEASSVPFGGRVYFPLYNLLLPRSESNPDEHSWPWSYSADGVRECSLQKAEVCMFNYDNAGTAIVCVDSDENGEYVLPAPIGLQLYVKITLGSHTRFVRNQLRGSGQGRFLVQPSIQAQKQVPGSNNNNNNDEEAVEVFTFEEGALPYQNMDYEDRTSRVLHLDAHGTLCKFRLGTETTFSIKAPGSCGSMEMVMPTSRFTDGHVLLPAHPFEVTLESVDPPYPEVTDKSRLLIKEKYAKYILNFYIIRFGYFHRLRTRSVYIDLFEGSVESVEDTNQQGLVANASIHNILWRYHPRPQLETSFYEQSSRRADL